jgi:hypothetical protein
MERLPPKDERLPLNEERFPPNAPLADAERPIERFALMERLAP